MGNTWKFINLRDEADMYFFKVLFDENNSEILYATGIDAREPLETSIIYLYRSTDTGNSWHLAHEEDLGTAGNGQVYDMVKYKNKIFFYSFGCGIVELELEF